MEIDIELIEHIKSQVPISAEATYGDGVFDLDLQGNCNVIKINYTGRITAIANEMPLGTFARMNKTKILIYKNTLEPFPKKLFNYDGSLRVKRVVLYGHKTKISANIVNVSADETWRFQNHDSTWNQEESNWEGSSSLNKYSTSIRPGLEGLFITNQYSNGKYKNANGSDYIGLYYTSSDGSILKGAKPGINKEHLYIKMFDKVIKADTNMSSNIKKNLTKLYRSNKSKNMLKENNKKLYRKTKGGY